MKPLNKILIGTVSFLFVIFIASFYFQGSSFSAADNHKGSKQHANNEHSKEITKAEKTKKEQNVTEPQPKIISSATCNIPSPPAQGKVAYLTFDDGPSKYTTTIINILNQNQMKGTFFLIGNNIQYHKDSVRALINNCETIGSHTMTHNPKIIYNKTNPTFVQENISNRALLLDEYHYKVDLARAPYGSTYLTPTMLDGLYKNNFKLWDWTIDSEDWRYKPSERQKIVENISKQLRRNTEVILMHEREGTVEVLPQIIQLLKSKGYTTFLPYDSNHHLVENFRHDERF